ncbi:GNAT family N-acetyltransferase [Streptomyces chumphonensis]|uniref:GNAT family N-acetyltransferase n=1 Tax=Streptomyces chumphonensis TaxID=1214925 RepID=UPI003D71A10E
MDVTTDLTVRPALPEELDTIGELTAEAYLGDGLLDFGEEDPYLAELRDVRRRSLHAEVLVAADERNDEVLGAVAFVGEGGPYADLAGPGEGEFRMLAVRREGRGRGAGEALVRACVDRARARGLARLVLSSQAGMEPAHRLYRRLGFVRTPERDWEPLPGFGPLWTFARELSA